MDCQYAACHGAVFTTRREMGMMDSGSLARAARPGFRITIGPLSAAFSTSQQRQLLSRHVRVLDIVAWSIDACFTSNFSVGDV